MSVQSLYRVTETGDFRETEDELFRVTESDIPAPDIGTGEAGSDGGGVASIAVVRVTATVDAASDGGGVSATATLLLSGVVSAGSDGGGVDASSIMRILATGAAGSESGAQGVSVVVVLGTGSAGSESGSSAAGVLRIPGTASAGSESGASASGALGLSGTGQAGSESGATASGVVIYPPVVGSAEAGSDGGGAYVVGRLVVVLLPGTVGRHTIEPFHSPVQGVPVNPDIVRGNDTITQRAFNSHDEDPTIHIQSSAMARRPAAGVAGRIWVTESAGVYELWFDDGSTWQPIT